MVQRQETASGGSEIDISALLGSIARSKWTIILPTLAAFVLSIVAVNLIKPRFTAETRVLLESRDSEYTRAGRDGQAGRDSERAFDPEAVTSQAQLMQSRDLARAMIQRFELGKRPEFDPVLDGVGPITKALVLMGLVRNPASISPEERVLESYYDKLKAFAVGRSRVLAVEFQSRDPELAAALSNAIAQDYIRRLEAAKRDTASSASSWLGRTITDLRERVAGAEAKVEAFRASRGLLSGGEATTITAQQLSELATQLVTARAQQAELSARARVIRDAVRDGRTFEVSEVIRDDVVRRLIESRASLRAQLAQEERTLLPQHPRIKELNAQLAGLDGQVRAAAERAARALDNDTRSAAARVASISAEMEGQKRTAATANEAEVQLRALEREAKAERDQLESYLARFRDASVREGDNAVAADARIVSRAIVPSNPSFPKKGPIVAIATMGALTLALFFVLTRELLSGRATRPVPPPRREPGFDEAAGMTAGVAAPVALAAPPLQPALEDLSAQAATPLHQSLARLRAAVRPSPVGVGADAETAIAAAVEDNPATASAEPAPAARSAGDGALALAAPAPRPAADPAGALSGIVARLSTGDVFAGAARQALVLSPEGRAADVALALGRLLAAERRTILVDLDPASTREADGAITRFSGGPEAAGIADLLAGAATFGEAIHRDPRSRLHLMPAGQPLPAAGDPAEQMALILEALRQTYGVVLLHGGPPSAGLARLAARMDEVVTVAEAMEQDTWATELPATVRRTLVAPGAS
jgi:uncharacterized protein involved in exopolysaccharide biosynthesis/Mrp family chromosome partitioning ATPase